MQNNDTSIFKKFKNLDHAKELIELLESHDISCELGDDFPSADITFVGENLPYNYEIRIALDDFPKAHQIIRDQIQELIKDVNESHYLFEFTDDELLKIVNKPDEWNEFDYYLAIHILKQRGHVISEEELVEKYKERINDLSMPEEVNEGWIIAGYIFSFLGGFGGVIIGYFFWKTKKTLPNGEKVFAYYDDDRRKAKIMFFVGLIVFIFIGILKLWVEILAYSTPNYLPF